MMMSSQAGGGQVTPTQAAAAMSGAEKPMTLRLLFFLAALCTLAAGIIASIKMLFTFPPATMSFFSQLYLVLLGLVMAITDLPLKNDSVHIMRHRIFKYMEFLNRFTCKGMWYSFLGTMIWAALWDLNISWFLGFILGLYVILLGIGTMMYGIHLTLKLQGVRKSIMDSDTHGGEPVCPDKGFSKQSLKEMLYTANQTQFSDDEMEYVMEALARLPNPTVISKMEYQDWLKPGLAAIV
jgi:hypothetical protein